MRENYDSRQPLASHVPILDRNLILHKVTLNEGKNVSTTGGQKNAPKKKPNEMAVTSKSA